MNTLKVRWETPLSKEESAVIEAIDRGERDIEVFGGVYALQSMEVDNESRFRPVGSFPSMCMTPYRVVYTLEFVKLVNVKVEPNYSNIHIMMQQWHFNPGTIEQLKFFVECWNSVTGDKVRYVGKSLWTALLTGDISDRVDRDRFEEEYCQYKPVGVATLWVELEDD